VVEPPPWAWGWFDHPSKGQKQKMGFRHLGLAVPPPRALGGFDHPYAQGGDLATLKRPTNKTKNGFRAFGGGPTTPKGWGWLHPHTSRRGWPKPATPKSPKPIFLGFFFFFFLAFWGGQTTPLAMGVVRPPLDRPWGQLPPIFFFFVFCFLIFSFF
jgi:hypothetical protein